MEIKPCPFCGESEEIGALRDNMNDCWRIHCAACAVMSGPGSSEKEAAERWNARDAEYTLNVHLDAYKALVIAQAVSSLITTDLISIYANLFIHFCDGQKIQITQDFTDTIKNIVELRSAREAAVESARAKVEELDCRTKKIV